MLGYAIFSLCLVAVSALPAFKHRWTVSQVFVDFDGTIAANETILMFAQAVYTATPSDKITLPPLENFLGEYENNITLAREEYGSITTFQEEVDFAASDLRRNVDAMLYDRVAESGMIEYLTLETLEDYALAVAIRDGWWEFALAAMQQGSVPSILSNNFSIQWLRLILRTSYRDFQLRDSNATDDGLELADSIPIYCSEIIPTRLFPKSPNDHEYSSHGGSDKARLLNHLTMGHTRSSLYAGNSLTDLPPLVESGTGVLLGATEDVQNQLKTEGAKLVPLAQATLPSSNGREADLYVSPDWNSLITIFEN